MMIADDHRHLWRAIRSTGWIFGFPILPHFFLFEMSLPDDYSALELELSALFLSFLFLLLRTNEFFWTEA